MGNETIYETFMNMAYLPFSGFCKAGEFGYIHTIQPVRHEQLSGVV